MTLKENLLSFSGSLSIATTDAPDDYPEWRYITYEIHMADLKELWSKIRPELTKDAHRIDFIDKKLQEAFAAFDAGEKKKGRDAVWELYNLKIENFR